MVRVSRAEGAITMAINRADQSWPETDYIHEDTVSCEECGVEIVHLCVRNHYPDPNYYLCERCAARLDAEETESGN